MAGVKTNKAVIPFLGQQCYIRRTMRNFNEDDFAIRFKSIVIDEAFIIEEGVEIFIGTIRTKAHRITRETINPLFQAAGINIIASEGNFLEKFDEIKETALFIDTTTIRYEGGLCAFNTLPEDWIKSNY